MNKRKISFLFFGLILLILTINFASSVLSVCCQQLKTGAWCQMAQQTECAGNIFAQTSCDLTQFCRLGTCINEQSGECSPNVPQSKCESSGGIFDTGTVAEIPSCRNACCVFGDWVAFTNKAECKQIASKYGVGYEFLEDVVFEFDCYALGFPEDEGACMVNETDSITCRRMTKEECNSMGGDFNDGFLCTAPQLDSPCAKTSKTIIDNNKIYYIDSCMNKANIYDSLMYTTNPNSWTPQMIDYWTYIKKPVDSCQITGASNTCGNCDPISSGTIGRDYKSAKENTANNQLSSPVFGNNVCASMDCYYDTNSDGKKELYKNGEAWCAETPGTYHHIQYNFDVGFTDSMRKALSNVDKYNLPGSEYVRLRCSDGEVIVEPCKPYRNEFCVEQPSSTGFKNAQCLANNGRACLALDNKKDCDAPEMACRWIPGYRFDQKQTTDTSSRNNGLDNNGKEITDEDKLEVQTQGSCVPLIPIGMDFWGGEEQNFWGGEEQSVSQTTTTETETPTDAQICDNLGSVTQTAVYETHLLKRRSEFQKADTCDTSANSQHSAVARCFINCFLIPNYGKRDEGENYMDAATMYQIFIGEEGTNYADMCVSDRKGYYCSGKTGQVGVIGKRYGATCQGEGKNQLPIYYTYDEWLNSVRNRTRSLGDCGYKPSAYTGLTGVDINLETITVVFNELKQSGDVKTTSETKKIYAGNSMLNDTGYREI